MCKLQSEDVNQSISHAQNDNDAGPEPIDVFHSDEEDEGETVKKEKKPSTSTEASAQAASEFQSRLTSSSSKKTRCESNLLSLIKSGIIKIEPASDRPPKVKVGYVINNFNLQGVPKLVCQLYFEISPSCMDVLQNPFNHL